MPSVQWIEHKNKKILYMDIASQTTAEFIDIVNRIKLIVAREPYDSVLCLVDGKGGRFNSEISQITKEFAKQYEPHTKKIAIIGLDGLQKVVFNAVVFFTGSKKIFLKTSKEEALAWLVEE
jgi:hypothetical protein